MRKLTLNLDELAVDSFDTSVSDRETGTVKGHDYGWSDDSICPTVTYGRCCPP